MSTEGTTERKSPHKSLPRIDYQGRRPDPRRLRSPLPPSLTTALGDDPTLRAHGELVHHFDGAVERATQLALALESARREDEERRIAALTKGRKPPATKKAVGVEVELDEARGDVEHLGAVVVESASKVLAAAVRHLDAAHEAAHEGVEAALDQARDHLGAAAASFRRAEALAAEGDWLVRLRKRGAVPPFTGGGRVQPSPQAEPLVRQALVALDYDRRTVAEHREQDEREHEAAMRDLPPGQTIWKGGESFTVGKGGELVRDEP